MVQLERKIIQILIFFGELKENTKDEFYRILNKFEDYNLIDRNFDDPDKIEIHEQLYILAISIMNKFFSEKDLAS